MVMYVARATCVGLLEVTIPYDCDATTALAVAISFVPWVLGTFAVVCCRAHHLLRAMALCSLIVIACNEGMIKKLVRQPRPVGSCLQSQGMPSSHTMMSVAWLVVLYTYRRGCTWFDTANPSLVLVPWARWHLHDHSAAQVAVGGGVGLLLGVFIVTMLPHRVVFGSRGLPPVSVAGSPAPSVPVSPTSP